MGTMSSRRTGQQQMGNQENRAQTVPKNHVALVTTKRRTRSKNWGVPICFISCCSHELLPQVSVLLG